MTILATLLALAALAADVSPAAAATTSDQVGIAALAVRASNTGLEEKQFDAGLAAVRGLLAELPYDTFKRAADERKRTAFGSEARFPLSDTCVLIVQPLERESDGRVRLQARVEVESKRKPGERINALVSTNRVVPGDRLMIRGLPAESGELILFLTVTL